MNRKLFSPALLAAAFGLSACAEVTAPAPIDDGAQAGVVQVGSLQMYLREPTPAGSGGWCGTDASGLPDGTWMKIEGGVTVIHLLHEHCIARV